MKLHNRTDIITGAISNDDSSASCVPEPEIKWDQCVNRDESLAGTPDSTIDNTGISLFLGWRDFLYIYEFYSLGGSQGNIFDEVSYFGGFFFFTYFYLQNT